MSTTGSLPVRVSPVESAKIVQGRISIRGFPKYLNKMKKIISRRARRLGRAQTFFRTCLRAQTSTSPVMVKARYAHRLYTLFDKFIRGGEVRDDRRGYPLWLILECQNRNILLLLE